VSLKYKVDKRIIVDDPDTAAEEIKEIAKDWKKLGYQLSLNIAELNQIESFSTNNKLAVVLKKKQAKNYAEGRHFHYFELMTAVRNVDKDIYNSLMK
jgi:tRNA G18 (ribose-2'-O)-methylase SpoU